MKTILTSLSIIFAFSGIAAELGKIDITPKAFSEIFKRTYGNKGFFRYFESNGSRMIEFSDRGVLSSTRGSMPCIANQNVIVKISVKTQNVIPANNSNALLIIAERFDHKKLKMINMEFYLDEMYPEGTTAMLERLTDKPVYITENGCSCNDDSFRIIYISLYLSAIKDAIARGVDIRGYFYWSLMDNYEWGSFLPRFGLVNVDFETFERTPKTSAAFYRDIIQNNGFNQEILRRYLNENPSLHTKNI